MLELQDDLKATRTERERLEQNNERLRKDLQIAQNSDLAYAQVYMTGTAVIFCVC